MINRFFLTLILLISLSIKPALCFYSDEFKEKLTKLRWIAYAPTNFDPNKNIYPSEDSIKKDLKVIYKYGFNGIVTYGADKTLAQIPRLAYEMGFLGVIMGIWDIEDREEIINAVLTSEFVDGYCVGNEGLNSRYDLDCLNKAISTIRQSTHKPVTTSEQISDYSNDKVFLIGDWIFPNIHPFLHEVKDPQKAARWIERHYRILKKHCPVDKIILFKEVGFPTRGMSKATELNQKVFFENIENKRIPFVYFEAFDQKWKQHLPCEPYWGLFNYKRRPKEYISSICMPPWQKGI